jgi:hypothetical protein
MDSSPDNQSNPQPNNHNNNPVTDTASQRPFKVQKTNHTSLNIPVFMGPIPTIHHFQNTNYLPYNTTNLQNERNHDQETNYGQETSNGQEYNQQGTPRFQQESPRRQQATNSNTTTPPNPGKTSFCMYKEEHVAEGLSTCSNSLIGKILSNKTILKPVLFNTLQGIWGNPKGLAITEVEGGYFHITMDLEKDVQRALKGIPWMVRNS